jgi:hypothetical protein
MRKAELPDWQCGGIRGEGLRGGKLPVVHHGRHQL